MIIAYIKAICVFLREPCRRRGCQFRNKSPLHVSKLSSQSRFVRVAFTKLNSRCGESEEESVSQFFHILGSVDQQRGCCHLGEGKYEITLYTSCCNTDRGIYYYTTYDNHRIIGVDMHREDLESGSLIRYAPVTKERIPIQNAPKGHGV